PTQYPGRIKLDLQLAGDRRRSMHPQPAGDVDRLTRHVARLVRSQENGYPRDIIRIADAAQRNGRLALFGRRQTLLDRHAVRFVAHARLNDSAWADGVDVDFVRCQLGSKRLSYADHGEFGGAIGPIIGFPDLAEPRGHVDDAAKAALEHVRNHSLAAVEHTADV